MSEPDKPYTYEKIHEELEEVIKRIAGIRYTPYDYRKVSLHTDREEAVYLTVYNNSDTNDIMLRFRIYSMDEYTRLVNYVMAKHKVKNDEQRNKD